MMYWHDGSFGWVGWAVMVFMMAAFWLLVAWVVVTVVRSSGDPRAVGSNRTGPTGPTAEEILAERFARGEIDEEEYTRRREVLRKSGPLG